MKPKALPTVAGPIALAVGWAAVATLGALRNWLLDRARSGFTLRGLVADWPNTQAVKRRFSSVRARNSATATRHAAIDRQQRRRGASRTPVDSTRGAARRSALRHAGRAELARRLCAIPVSPRPSSTTVSGKDLLGRTQRERHQVLGPFDRE